MKIIFTFDRNKPFANLPDPADAAALVARYERQLADHIGQHRPGDEVEVRAIDDPPGDVEFEPEDALSPDERLAVALEVKRIAHRLADEITAEHLRSAAADEGD